MKILIIAFDGLEYTLVDKGYFPNLKQKEYGKVVVPITKEIGEPQTTIVWTSFLTGKTPNEHGVTKPAVWNFELLNKVVGLFSNIFIRHFLLSHKTLGQSFRRILKLFGIKQTTPKLNDLHIKTFFDEIKNSVAMSIPLINEDVISDSVGIIDAILDKNSREKYLKKLFRRFEDEKKQFWEAFINNPTLLMVHFQISDLYGHIYCKTPQKLLNLYSELDEFVGDVKRVVERNCLLLIISDHGIDTNYGHSPYGFYSTNISLELKTPNITNFYDLLLRWTNEN